jgi:signal transduction histidine kinase
VQDNGRGFDTSLASQGMGLQNIRTRVASYNGILNIDSRESEGTEINVELKIEN